MFQQPLLRTTTVPEEAANEHQSTSSLNQNFSGSLKKQTQKTDLLFRELKQFTKKQSYWLPLKAIINTKCLSHNYLYLTLWWHELLVKYMIAYKNYYGDAKKYGDDAKKNYLVIPPSSLFTFEKVNI